MKWYEGALCTHYIIASLVTCRISAGIYELLVMLPQEKACGVSDSYMDATFEPVAHKVSLCTLCKRPLELESMVKPYELYSLLCGL